VSSERHLRFAFYVIPFIALATLNSGGYRYGASDQAFYQPAVLLQLDPALFPRDAAVLAAQTHLTMVDELIARAVEMTGASLPGVFLVMYIGALVLLAAGVWQIGRRLYRSEWAVLALLAALTLRHAIARSGANTLEGYFHPRMIAYALGAMAIAWFLRGRLVAALALIAVAGSIHPTTALWFGVWFAAAAWIAYPALRKWITAAVAVGTVGAGWALTIGPLAGRLAVMDPEWRQALATKDYLFPLQWPAYAWISNFGYLPVIAWVYRRRVRAGLVDRYERALTLGSASLAAVFAAALGMHAIGVTIAIQLQPARVFWMFDFLATVYGVWALAEGGVIRLKTSRQTGVNPVLRRTEVIALLLILSFSMARGAYVMVRNSRPVLQVGIADDDWGRVMAFARTTDKRSHWLADPIHAALYGTSVRVAGERDVFVEAIKDAAIGMYDRDVAMRTAQRLAALPDYNALTAAGARKLSADFDIDFFVTANRLELPLAFESGALRVYRLE
jgi:hypothetical protein